MELNCPECGCKVCAFKINQELLFYMCCDKKCSFPLGYDDASLYLTRLEEFHKFYFQVQTALIRYKVLGRPQVTKRKGPKSHTSDSTTFDI